MLQAVIRQFSFIALILSLLSCPLITPAVFSKSLEKQPEVPGWSLLTGYGVSYPGLGRSETRVETADIFLRYERVLIQGTRSSWYNGNHYLLVEPVIHFLVEPSGLPMIGINILGRYIFPGTSDLKTYILGGGGIVYVDEEIDGVGSKLNANYQFGLGLSYPASDDRSLFLELRYHHISNGDSADPNIPVNSFKFLVGITF